MKETLGEQPLVRVRDLSFHYGERAIFDHVDLDIPRGKVVAIMGPSGCGKTTLLRIISGQIRPRSGSVVVDGLEVPGLSRAALLLEAVGLRGARDLMPVALSGGDTPRHPPLHGPVCQGERARRCRHGSPNDQRRYAGRRTCSSRLA